MSDGRPTQILKSIAGTIRDQMRLREDQVILARQKFNIPPTGDLLVVLSAEDPKLIGNNSRVLNNDALGLEEDQYLTIRDLIQIDILAMTNTADGSNQARDNRNQVLIALFSIASQQAQDIVGYYLAKLPVSFANTSVLEETEYLERYTMSIAVTYGEAAKQFPSYYDQFGPAEIVVNE